MATVKLILEKSQPLKNGTYALVFQIIHRRSKKLIYTPYKIFFDEFDTQKGQIIYLSDDIKNKDEVASANRAIKKQRKSIESHILELGKRGIEYKVGDISSRYRIANDELSLLGYFDFQISRKLEQQNMGSYKTYRSTRASIAKFLGHKHARISDIDFAFVRDYEEFLINNNVSANTICYYIRNFKSIYNQSSVDGYTLPDKHPFKYVKSKPEKTTKRALDRDSLIRIRDMEFPPKRKILELARDLFLFSFFSRGMSMIDILHLTNKNIKNGVLSYRRKKTNQYLEMIINNEMKNIIDKYKNDSDYIFPILKGDDVLELRRLSLASLDRTNRHLKEIGVMLGLSIDLTTYVARHSWATEAKNRGIPTAVISEGLGHTSEKTTRIYLKSFNNSVIDLANESVINLSCK